MLIKKHEKELYPTASLSPNYQNFMVSLILFAHTLFHVESNKKSHFQAPLLPSGLSAVAVHRGHAVHWLSKKHTHLRKNKSPFLKCISLFFFPFLLLMLHRWDSLFGIPSWIFHCQQSDDWMFNPILIVMMTFLFPFLDYSLPLSTFQHLPFNFCTATAANFQHI